MSSSNKKKQVLDRIALLRTTAELNNQKTFSDAFGLDSKATKDPFILIIDLLKVVVGVKAINDAIDSLLKNVKKFESDFKVNLKREVKDFLGGDKNTSTPSDEIKQKGFKINILKLDPHRKMFTSDDVTVSEYMTPFQRSLSTVVKNANTEIKINKITTVQYNNVTGDLTFKFEFSSDTLVDFIYGLIDEMVLIEVSSLMSNIIDSMFNHSNKGGDELAYDEQVNLILNKFITDDDRDDSYFKFDGEDVTFIEEKYTVSKEHFYGVPEVDGSLSKADFLALKKKYKKYNTGFFTDLLDILVTGVQAKSKETAKQGFLSKFLTALKDNILKNFLFSPEIILIYNLLENTSDDGLTYIKKNKNFVKCLMKAVINKLLTTLFEMLKKEILLIVSGVAKKYIEESIAKYKKILMSVLKPKVL